jgi:predicted PurR-regulated permease PerM
MRFSLKKLFSVIFFFSIILTVMIYVLPSIIQNFNSHLIRGHQLSVIKELEGWGNDYSQIKTSQEAQKATEILAYIEKYYVPADGYRSDANTEQKLERQREHTIRRITDALEEYSAKIGANESGSIKVLE